MPGFLAALFRANTNYLRGQRGEQVRIHVEQEIQEKLHHLTPHCKRRNPRGSYGNAH